MKINIAINGFGRIGRLVTRAIFDRKLEDKIKIKFINSPGCEQTKRYLWQYDSIHGKFNQNLEADNGKLIVNKNYIIDSLSASNAEDLDCSGIDYLFECSGKFKNSGYEFIKNGAKNTLISAPASKVDRTHICGVNDVNINDKVISLGSCTTNCIAPMLYVMNKHFSINHINAITIHAVTNDQSNVDRRHKDLRRGRACYSSIIPTSTGSEKTIELVMPELKGKIICSAYRAPVNNVSIVDMFVNVNEKIESSHQINSYLQAYSAKYPNIMGYSIDPVVSIDFNGAYESCIFDQTLTKLLDENSFKISAWYDNEYGFSNRMIDYMLEHYNLSQ